MSESALGDHGAELHLLSGTCTCHFKNSVHIESVLATLSLDKVTLPRSGSTRSPSYVAIMWVQVGWVGRQKPIY